MLICILFQFSFCQDEIFLAITANRVYKRNYVFVANCKYLQLVILLQQIEIISNLYKNNTRTRVDTAIYAWIEILQSSGWFTLINQPMKYQC